LNLQGRDHHWKKEKEIAEKHGRGEELRSSQKREQQNQGSKQFRG